MTRFSIILPVFNGQEFLQETIESVRNQTFLDWELIIVNDGSTDSTEKIALDYAKYDSRIKIVNQANLGLSSARNTGIAHCDGELFGFLDADDKLLPDCLETISSKFCSLDADLLISGYFYFKDNLQLHLHKFQNRKVYHNSFIDNNLAPPVAHFIRKNLALQIGSFDSSLKSCEDWDFWIRAGRIGAKIYTIPEVLVGYRYVPNSMSRNPRVMYDALTEVSRRAGQPDNRLSEHALFNRSIELDYPSIQKKHFIRMLGVMLHQGNISEAVEWYSSEQKVWKWEVSDADWKGLATYLSWGYFFESDQIDKLLSETVQEITEFFKLVGYSKKKIQSLNKMIFAPQLKRRNYQKYGKLVGGILNKLMYGF